MKMQSEVNEFPFYSPEELANMSNEEQQMLDLRFYTYGVTTGTIYMPYKNKEDEYNERNRVGKYTGIRIYHPNQMSLDEIRTQLYPELTSYISVNVLQEAAKSNQKNEYEYIAELYIDIDVCHDCPERLPIELPKVQKALEEAMERKLIPLPTKYMMTGRGFALHYKYNSLLPLTCTEAKVHVGIYKIVMGKIEEIVTVAGDDVEVDPVVFNINRVARVAGTKNPKAGTYCRILAMGPRYSVFELRNAFGISPEESLRGMSDAIKSQKKNASKERNIRSVWYVPTLNELPRTTKPQRLYAGFLLKCLDMYYERTTWVEGKHRERFLFIYYNCFKMLYGAVEAYKKIKELNSAMQCPLYARELYYLMKHTDEHIEQSGIHGDGFFLFGKDTVIEILEISREDADACGFYKNEHKAVMEQIRRVERQRRKEELEKAVLELYLVHNMGSKMIEKNLPPELNGSRSSIRRIIKKNGLCEDDKGKEYLFSRYYTRGPLFYITTEGRGLP